MAQRTDPSVPTVDLPGFGDEDRSVCPDCEHRREVAAEDWVDHFCRWWRSRHPSSRQQPVRVAQCEWRAETMGDTCGCENAFHAS